MQRTTHRAFFSLTLTRPQQLHPSSKSLDSQKVAVDFDAARSETPKLKRKQGDTAA
jgi:hypothetical protein